jgi:hypothetical protein
MPKTVRVGTTERKTHSVTQNGYGFDIEKCGTGLSAGSWQPVCQLIYPTEDEAKEAEATIRQAIRNVVHVQGFREI